MSQSVWLPHKVPQTGARTADTCFSQPWRLKSRTKVPARLVSGEDPLPCS